MKTRSLAAIGIIVILLSTAGNEVAAATLYVSQSSPNPTPPYAAWDTAAHTIQEAVDAASDGDTVLVAPDQYGLTNQVTVAKAIALRSTMGAGQTFLNSPNNIWCLWISNSLAVADGFTMQDTSPFRDRAGGAYLVGGTVQNCNFTNYTLWRQGAAVVMAGGILSNSIVTYNRHPDDGNSAVYCSGGGLITDCQILGKGGAGFGGVGVYLVDSQLRNSIISGDGRGGPWSGGAAVHALSSTIVGCTITRNYNAYARGGGAYLDGCLMDRCIVADNRCGDGGGRGSGGGIFATNSIIRDSLIVSNRVSPNSAEPSFGGLGGGVYMQGGALVNCTVSANSVHSGIEAPGQGGGIYVESGVVRNAIVYFNSASSNANWYNGGGSFDHSCTTPDPGGAGNLVEDPQFVDRTNGNYRLAPTSPCIDAGINEEWMAGAFDLDGNPRIINGTVDLGAWESPLTLNTAPVARIQIENAVTFLANPTVITLNASSGKVILDGAQSSDAENDPLTYTWSVGDPPEAFATGSRVTEQVPTGSYVFQLQVSDGELARTEHVSVAVLTPCDAIALLSLRLSESSHRSGIKRLLLGCLQVSCNSFDHGKVDIGIRHLENFQVKVAEKLGEVDPAFAELLTHAAQTLMDGTHTARASIRPSAPKDAGRRR